MQEASCHQNLNAVDNISSCVTAKHLNIRYTKLFNAFRDAQDAQHKYDIPLSNTFVPPEIVVMTTFDVSQ